jgi:hypothetical protein
MPTTLRVLIVALLVTATPATAQEPWVADRPDSHAPAGVPHGHMLAPGQFLVGYRYAYGRSDQLRSGTDDVTAGEVFALGYTHAPTAMNEHRHVVELQYAPNERVTLLAELPFRHGDITYATTQGTATDQSVSGLGDVRVGGLFRLLDRNGRHAHGSLVFSLPTGGADERDEAGSLPYAVQPGSGTFDLSPAVTFTEQRLLWSWGAQMGGTARLGESPEGFRIGNRVDASLWAARRLLAWASGSVRLSGAFWGDVRHRGLDFPASPAAEPGFTGGTRIEMLAGGNLHAAAGIFQGHRLFGEIGFPIYQDLDGPQLGLGWRGSLGWRWLLGPS